MQSHALVRGHFLKTAIQLVSGTGQLVKIDSLEERQAYDECDTPGIDGKEAFKKEELELALANALRKNAPRRTFKDKTVNELIRGNPAGRFKLHCQQLQRGCAECAYTLQWAHREATRIIQVDDNVRRTRAAAESDEE